LKNEELSNISAVGLKCGAGLSLNQPMYTVIFFLLRKHNFSLEDDQWLPEELLVPDL